MGYGGGSEFCASTAGGAPFRTSRRRASGLPVAGERTRRPRRDDDRPRVRLDHLPCGGTDRLHLGPAIGCTIGIERAVEPRADRLAPGSAISPIAPAGRCIRLLSTGPPASRTEAAANLSDDSGPYPHPSVGRALAVQRICASRRHAWSSPSTSCPHRQQSVTSSPSSRWHPQWGAPVVGQVGEKAI